MKRLNFYPFYEEYLRSQKKTTTFRLSSFIPFEVGEEVMISIGWTEEEAIDLHPARIRMSYRRRICDLEKKDFEGESPDCKSPEPTRLVLSCIYRTVLKENDEIWVIKFDYMLKKL